MYKVCFVDDLAQDVCDTASLSLCSNRLLFPEDILEPLEVVVRKMVYALASQWMGVNIVPLSPSDWWVVVGGALFMTDMFLQTLFGRNDYRYRQKIYMDRVVELDVKKPPLYQIGPILRYDPSEWDFMKLKASSVLFILNQRLIKQSGKNGIGRCLWRTLLDAKTNKLGNGEISTEYFHRICEKVGHVKLEAFFNQWIYGSGCPSFLISQRFNKKKMHVEMTIRQTQGEQQGDPNEAYLNSENFMQSLKEQAHDAHAGPVQPLFTVSPLSIDGD